MSMKVINQSPYLRTSREFPEEMQSLTVEVNRSYLDIAQKVNDRTIGLYPSGKPSITGENWFVEGGKKQQTLRQVYKFTAVGNIPHGINFAEISSFTLCYGQFTDNTNWYGLISASPAAIAGQMGFYLDPTNIIFTVGAGAPTLTNGMIVLEWLLNP